MKQGAVRVVLVGAMLIAVVVGLCSGACAATYAAQEMWSINTMRINSGGGTADLTSPLVSAVSSTPAGPASWVAVHPWWVIAIEVAHLILELKDKLYGYDPVYPDWSGTWGNTQFQMDGQDYVGWLKPGRMYSVELPEHFAFDRLVGVLSTVPEDLELGSAYLMNARTLVIPVVANNRTQPQAAITMVADIWFDGCLGGAPYFCTVRGSMDMTTLADPITVLDSGDFTKEVLLAEAALIPEPSSLLALGSGLLGLGGVLFRRRQDGRQ